MVCSLGHEVLVRDKMRGRGEERSGERREERGERREERA